MSLQQAENERLRLEFDRLNAQGWAEDKGRRVRAVQAANPGMSFERAWDVAEQQSRPIVPEPTTIGEAAKLVHAQHPTWTFQQSWDHAEAIYPGDTDNLGEYQAADDADQGTRSELRGLRQGVFTNDFHSTAACWILRSHGRPGCLRDKFLGAALAIRDRRGSAKGQGQAGGRRQSRIKQWSAVKSSRFSTRTTHSTWSCFYSRRNASSGIPSAAAWPGNGSPTTCSGSASLKASSAGEVCSMANRATKRLRKQIAQTFAAERKAGRTITSPPSKRSSKWKGARSGRSAAAS